MSGKFIVIVACEEARAVTGTIMTRAGDLALVIEEPDGWVEATSTRWKEGDPIRKDAKVFPSREAAEKFGMRWKGHPWWTMPKGFKVLEVKPHYKQVLVGYSSKEPA